MIQLCKVTAGYPGKIIFRDLDLTFADRGCYALTGPSGIGKTTLLRLIMSDLTPLSGRVVLPENCRISCVFQEDRLLPWLSVLKNVSIVSDEDTAKRVLNRLGIDSFTAKPAAFSGGMNRRVAIARAVAFGGDVLLMDEPFKGLDDQLKDKTAQFLRSCFECIILTTHDRADITRFDAHEIPVNGFVSDKV